MKISEKPVPVVSTWAQPFWDAARDQRLIIQKCSHCEQFIFYPRAYCPHCSADGLQWVEVSGKGNIYSYTVVESNAPSAFIADMPFVIAVVILKEGVRMLSNIIDCDPSSIGCDMPVEVTFDVLDGNFTLPKFRPIISELNSGEKQ